MHILASIYSGVNVPIELKVYIYIELKVYIF